MRLRIRPRLVALVAFMVIAPLVPGCGCRGTPGPPPPPLVDAIPPENLPAFTKAHLEGLGYMEQFKYPQAIVAFRKAHELAPGLIAGSINLAIATLNDTGTQEEKKKNAGGEVEPGKFERAIALLDEVLAREPGNLHAHFCRGIILQYVGQLDAARPDFQFVTEKDPADASAWLYLGITISAPSTAGKSREEARREMGAYAAQLIDVFTRAVERNPYHVQALYRLQRAQILAGQREAYDRTFALWQKLDPSKDSPEHPGDPGGLVYGEMGKYATVIDPFTKAPIAKEKAVPPKFDPPKPLDVALADGERWAKESDFAGKLAPLGRARARFGAAVAAFDADGDGLLDVYLAGAIVGPNGVRDALLLNRGDGRFEDASKRFGLPDGRAGLAVAAGDFDADRRIDLFVTGLDGYRLFRNVGGKAFEDATRLLPPMGPPAISPCARWMDLDQDGDLDLFVVNYTAVENAGSAFTDRPPPGLRNAAYRNDGIPPASSGPRDTWAPIGTSKNDEAKDEGLSLRFTAWDAEEALPLLGGPDPHTAVAILDIDDDRDLDLVVAADGRGPRFVLNDRLGRFHDERAASGVDGPWNVSGLLTADLDRDGKGDLVGTAPSGATVALRNATTHDAGGRPVLKFEPYPLDARLWRSAALADADLDGALDLLGLPAIGSSPALLFGRAEGTRLATSPLALGPDGMGALQGFTYADLVGDALPDVLMLRDGDGPRLARHLGNGHRWIGLEIGGRWDVKPKTMRTNVEGLGVHVTVQGDGLYLPYDHTTPEAGPSQSVAPVVLGIGNRDKARLVRLKWPDGVLQCELDEDADKLIALIENNRKEGSCPVLFTWDGRRMVCLGDFLGGGGLGYLVAPGAYGEPDRDEGVAIAADQLRSVDGVYRMAIAEPMSELAYLDRLTLEVVDRPPGVESHPDERFAPGGNRPTGANLAWRVQIEPVSAEDLKGRDVSEALRRVDRRFADDFRRIPAWVGYAEEHGIVLDFGDRLSGLKNADRVALVLTGVTEYPYSQTNYAAATAGVAIRPPVLERQRPDGSWGVIEPDPGYPAGMMRTTTLELTGKLVGPSCKVRLRTNMDIAWDRAFLAPIDAGAPLRTTTLPVANARLAHRGYLREVSPDGLPPLTYDYDSVDPAPLAPLVGRLTRFGDVAPLLRDDDDRLCILGPGDEVRLEFDSRSVPALPEGWSRSFVLRAVGYCKDADPFTAGSDTVGPLPWKGMPAGYPFGPGGERPIDPLYREYLRTYQTRSVGR